jgi:hypothetical protein
VRDAIEEGDGHGLTVNHHLKLFAPEPLDELARLVEDHHVRVNQLGLDAYHVVLRLRRRGLLRLLRAGRLGEGREAEHEGLKEQARASLRVEVGHFTHSLSPRRLARSLS